MNPKKDFRGHHVRFAKISRVTCPSSLFWRGGMWNSWDSRNLHGEGGISGPLTPGYSFMHFLLAGEEERIVFMAYIATLVFLIIYLRNRECHAYTAP